MLETIVASTEAMPLQAAEKFTSWAEQDPILRDLWAQNLSPDEIGLQLGRSGASVLTRAARLGLPRRFSPGRKRLAAGAPRQTTRKPIQKLDNALFKTALAAKEGAALRVCLMCTTPFMSEGRHNRICTKCKGGSDYEAATRLPDLEFFT